MRSHLLLVLALGLGLMAGVAGPPVVRAQTDAVDAVLVVGQDDLGSLLASGYFRDYALVPPEVVGLDPEALTTRGQWGPDALLTPRDLGLDPARPWLPFGGLSPHFWGFLPRHHRPPLPVFVFRPPIVVVPPPAPVFSRVAIVTLPPPVLLPPPAPLAAPPPPLPPPARAAVPIIPEAESLVLLALGLAGVAAMAMTRRRRAPSRDRGEEARGTVPRES